MPMQLQLFWRVWANW